MNKILVIILIILIIIGGYYVFTTMSKQNNTTQTPNTQQQGSNNQSQGQTQVPASSQTETVTIKNFAFSPATVTIKAGSTVKWINQDSATHQIKSDLFNSSALNTGDSYEFTFNTPGQYDYTCAIHPSMKGKIIVQ